jgi:iron complex outermembrane receptor protein
MARVRGLIGGVLLAVLWMAPLRAQGSHGTIRGRVIDDATQQPLFGVTVTFGSRGALTQTDGHYLLTGVPASTDTLRARIVGYAPAVQSVTVMGGDTVVVDLAMTRQAIGLSEVVVIGYGEQRAGNVTGAVSQVSAAEFNTGRVVSPQQLIASKVAGVQVVDNNEPGGGLSVRIRGATSINASSDPLYVIDGMPVSTGAGGGISAGREALNFLNPGDVETITVLKDASAAAIYGANAANGVVIIKTKSGRGGPQIQYSGTASASSVTRLPQMLNATQFRAAVLQYGDTSQINQLGTANTDWFSLVDRTAFGQQHDVVISGAGQSNDYHLSVGYLNQDGIIGGSTTQRVSLGFNYQQRLFSDRLEVRTNLKGSRAFDEFTPGGVLSNAAQMGPTQPVFDPGSTTGYYNWPGNRLQSADNPVQILDLARAQGTTYRSVGNVQAAYSLPFLEGLKANVNLGYDVTNVSQVTFNPSVLHGETKSGQNGFFYRTDPSMANTVLETYLNYARPLNFAPGTIDATAGYSYSQSHAEYPSLTLRGLSTDIFDINGFPTALNVSPAGPNIQESKLISFFGRLTYNFNDRYLAAVSLRRDGSSRFGPSNAWGTFPSVAVAWRLSQEPFLRNLTALSDLKLRASWAKTGNQAFANYQQYTAYLPGNSQAQVQFGNIFVPTIRPSAVDPNIKWEQTSSTNIGLDYGFSDQRFSGAIDYYVKKTSDLIFTVPAAAGTNFSNFVTTNIGSMQNKGLEVSLSARMLQGGTGGLSWTADFTAARNSNKLTSISVGGAQQILVGGVAGGVGTTIQVLEPGQPINSFFVCQQSYQNGKPVQGKFVSLADTIASACNAASLRAFHDPAPKWMLGHSSYLSYHSFDLSFTLRAWLGNYVYNNVASNLGTYKEITRGSPYNLHADVLNTGFTEPQYLSDYYVQDGSFLRVDNITLGYAFRYRGQAMRLFGTVQNAFTITGYKGVDPTAGLNGIDNNIYPRSRTVTGGLSVQL